MPTTVTPSDEDEEIAAFEADEEDEITDVVGRPVQVGAVARGLSVVEAPRAAFSRESAGDAFAMGWGDEVDSLDGEADAAPQGWPAVTGTDTLAPRATPKPARPRARAPSIGGWLAVMVGVVGIFVGGTLTILAGGLVLGALRAPDAPPPPAVVVAAPVAPPPVVVAPPVAPPVEAPVVEAPVEAVATAAPKPRARTSKPAPEPEPVVVAEPEVVAAPPPPAPVAAPEVEEDDKKGLFRRKKDR